MGWLSRPKYRPASTTPPRMDARTVPGALPVMRQKRTRDKSSTARDPFRRGFSTRDSRPSR